MNVHCSSEALSSVRFRNPAVGLIQTVLIIDAASNQLPSITTSVEAPAAAEAGKPPPACA